MHDLASSQLTPQGLTELVGNEAFEGTTYLDVSDNPLGSDGLRVIAHSPHAAELAALNASNTGADDAGVAALADSTTVAPAKLGLRDNAITGAGVASLVAGKGFAKVEQLELGFNPVGDAGARAIAASDDARALRYLDLSGCKLGDDGAAALITSPNLTGLTNLLLAMNPLSPAALAPLQAPEHLPALTKLYVPAAALPDDTKARLEKARPGLTIELQY